ncbi:putative nucleobase-ascorbate transporter 9 [Rhododendron vialii]|uniref:putative nucleobase-ascorbate transporter 9 n=1 Tax=Rhododendron vialii TaxID=182163 RepID=UPI00265EF2EB|nr:putative nucleobase-ascorbate transporter 9 [Rhododendron vialii]
MNKSFLLYMKRKYDYELLFFFGDFQKFERTMRGMQGALIVASCFQMLIGFLGVWRNVVRFLTPLSMVPLLTFTGLGLYYLGFQMVRFADPSTHVLSLILAFLV